MKIIIVTLISVLVLCSLIMTGCEPRIKVVITNNTEQVLNIYLGDSAKGEIEFLGEVAPGITLKKTTNTPSIFSEYRVIAKNSQGDVVYNRLFSSHDFHKAITSLTIDVD